MPQLIFGGLSTRDFTALVWYNATSELPEGGGHVQGWCSNAMRDIFGAQGRSLASKRALLSTLAKHYKANPGAGVPIGPNGLLWFGPASQIPPLPVSPVVMSPAAAEPEDLKWGVEADEEASELDWGEEADEEASEK